jgi:hypothetical protein
MANCAGTATLLPVEYHRPRERISQSICAYLYMFYLAIAFYHPNLWFVAATYQVISLLV